MKELRTNFTLGLNLYCLLSISIFFFFLCSSTEFQSGSYSALSDFFSLLLPAPPALPLPFTQSEKHHADLMRIPLPPDCGLLVSKPLAVTSSHNCHYCLYN